MEALLLEDSFEDIFCDPALLECVDNPDGDSQADLEHVDTDSEMIVNEKDSASTSNGVSSSRAKALNKKEKGKLIEELRAISGVQLVDAVVGKLSQESHMQLYPDRDELLALLLDSSGEEMVTICAGLGDNFVSTYMNCNKGKDKYARFQVQWHHSCSKFLLPVQNIGDHHLDNLPPDQLWYTLTRSTSQEVRNPLMIAITAAVYGFMLQQVRVLIKEDGGGSHTYTLESEPDEVYLRFGGGALAYMFTQCYKDMKSKKSSEKKENISQELQVLQWIRRVDKSTLPASLAYRDRGGMYFPDEAFLPFIKSIDECVRENANEECFKRYGKNLVRVITEQIQQNQLLLQQFRNIHAKIEGSAEHADRPIVMVFNEFTRKVIPELMNYIQTKCCRR